jgi:transmembrane protein
MNIKRASRLASCATQTRVATDRWASAIGVFGRILFTVEFWSSAVTKLLDFPGALDEMRHFNLSPAPAYAIGTIITQLLGSGLIIWGGRLIWLGAAILAVFTTLTIPIGHAYWLLPMGDARMEEVRVTAEHLTVIGAALLMICQSYFGGRGAPRPNRIDGTG